MSCLGKLFCSVLNERLVTYLKRKDFNTEFQIGFSENCKTSDHILTLKTLTDKYFQKKQKLYACFIDFRKAFDSVWRDALLYKLLKAGIGGPFGRLIQNIYSNTKVQIKLENGLTESFKDNVGVKQGCILSPALFKIFINDLPEIFGDHCHPTTLFKKKVSCLMFADDVVLVSETEEGLQNSLNEIFQYSEKWRLNVNTDKSKIMIFNKAGKMCKLKFLLGNEVLENVNSYNYLGITLTPSCNLKHAINALDLKAKKAMFKVRSSLFNTSITPDICMRIYDTLIRPISTYCAEVWGAFLPNTCKLFDIMHDKYKIFDDMCFEKTDLRFLKSILGVHRKATNAAVRGELGRYPTIIYIYKQVTKNWLRIAEYDKDSLLYDTYLCNMQLLFQNKNCWAYNIQQLIHNTLGLTDIWNNQGFKTKSTSQIKNVVKNLKYIFQFQWKNEINKESQTIGSGNKLRTYATFKKEFEYEQYLNFDLDFRKRREITKLRISAHRLEIELGRYQTKKNKIEAKDRLCTHCTLNQVEDEKHILFSCPKYDCHRKDMFNNLFEIFPGLSTLNEDDQFCFIMKCNDCEVFKILSNMITKIIEIRGNI